VSTFLPIEAIRPPDGYTRHVIAITGVYVENAESKIALGVSAEPVTAAEYATTVVDMANLLLSQQCTNICLFVMPVGFVPGSLEYNIAAIFQTGRRVRGGTVFAQIRGFYVRLTKDQRIPLITDCRAPLEVQQRMAFSRAVGYGSAFVEEYDDAIGMQDPHDTARLVCVHDLSVLHAHVAIPRANEC
jgi:hypothetical protein